MFNKKSILLVFLFSIFITSHLYANCGRCQAKVEVPVKKSSALVMTVPKSGDIEGLVMASCEGCNFGVKSKKGCSLSIKIGDTIYPVEGTSIRDNGNPHSGEGLCNAIRVAYTRGNIKEGKFYSRDFILLDSPE